MQTHPYWARVWVCVCSDAKVSLSWGTVWEEQATLSKTTTPLVSSQSQKFVYPPFTVYLCHDSLRPF